ncbi:hypothetical protein FDP41_001221 [Naegleria fowleri]|uniref:Gfo/Idh/MocA-like oxidoreductase N-terminal domain-containing protein n=1 Tax=Naegleria fowleri TaxID=5763 RepID=A0A6A5C2F0_NAEFO|nr:uncharacterized protein FDP41_001221 [Naegleria fowleri]KAF0980068.1 hypothetical protein FDP41_001221 [Naegleria fowleri]
MSSPSPQQQKRVVDLIVIGCGNRGKNYARYTKEHPDQCRLVAIAEPRKYVREWMKEIYNLNSECLFNDWQSLYSYLLEFQKDHDLSKDENKRHPPFLDPTHEKTVIICTQDQYHVEPALAFASLGFHILLEKPMAVKAEDCKRITKAVEENGVKFAVCHVLRYSIYTQRLKEILNSGLIGNIINIQHLEPVGWFHYAHSYVRGNWNNEQTSSPMLLAKSCHDIDWLCHVMTPHKVVQVSSFGSLMHCRKENKPEGAASRCLDCPSSIEEKCCYSAKKIYLDTVKAGHTGWPVSIIIESGEEPTVENVSQALRDGPYGRCVYESDNNVVDNQVVSLQFDNGATCTFTMIAYSKEICERKTRIYGTLGELEIIGNTIHHFDFLTQTYKKIELDNEIPKTNLSGHGYADYYLMKNFIDAICENDSSKLLSNARETLNSHLLVFTAEEARHSSTVIKVNDHVDLTNVNSSPPTVSCDSRGSSNSKCELN